MPNERLDQSILDEIVAGLPTDPIEARKAYQGLVDPSNPDYSNAMNAIVHGSASAEQVALMTTVQCLASTVFGAQDHIVPVPQ